MNLDNLDLDQLRELREEVERRILMLEGEKQFRSFRVEYPELEYVTKRSFKFRGLDERMYDDDDERIMIEGSMSLYKDYPLYSEATHSPYPKSWDDDKIIKFMSKLLELDFRQSCMLKDALVADTQGISYAQYIFMTYADEWPSIENFEVDVKEETCEITLGVGFTIDDEEYDFTAILVYGGASWQTKVIYKLRLNGVSVFTLWTDCDTTSFTENAMSRIPVEKKVLCEMLKGLAYMLLKTNFPDSVCTDIFNYGIRRFEKDSE